MSWMDLRKAPLTWAIFQRAQTGLKLQDLSLPKEWKSILLNIFLCCLTSMYYLNFRYSAGEIHFNLMALVSDRAMTYQKKISDIEKQMQVKKIKT